MKKPSNRRWILWIAVPAAIAGFLGLLALPFVIDEPPPDDTHLRPVRREVPRERNGFFAVNLTEAEADALVEKEPGEEDLSAEEPDKERKSLPFTDGWDVQVAERILKKKRRLLERFDESLRYPDFQVPEIDQSDATLLYTSALRRIVQLVLLRAGILFQREKELEAFQEALNVIRFGHRLQGADGILFSFLVGRGFQGSGLACLAHFIERTKLKDREVQSVLDSLPAFHEQGWKAALRREYLVMANAIDRLSRGEDLGFNWPGFIPRRLLIKPHQTKRIFGEAVKVLLDLPPLRPVAEKKQLCASALEKVSGPRWVPTNYLGKLVSQKLLEAYESALLNLAFDDFTRFAPKLLFALKRFHRDRGALPDSLDELVPAYLKEIPRDPFDGEKLRYDKGRKIVWAIGRDLNFNGFPEAEGTGIVDGPALKIGF